MQHQSWIYLNATETKPLNAIASLQIIHWMVAQQMQVFAMRICCCISLKSIQWIPVMGQCEQNKWWCLWRHELLLTFLLEVKICYTPPKLTSHKEVYLNLLLKYFYLNVLELCMETLLCQLELFERKVMKNSGLFCWLWESWESCLIANTSMKGNDFNHPCFKGSTLNYLPPISIPSTLARFRVPS